MQASSENQSLYLEDVSHTVFVFHDAIFKRGVHWPVAGVCLFS